MSKKLTAAAIPDKMKALPFCCWKREKNQQGEETKVPYNPKTGNRAKVDVPATFGTLKEALSAWGAASMPGWASTFPTREMPARRPWSEALIWTTA